VEGALAAYQRLCRLGLGVLADGGWLVLASCSSRVSKDDFKAAVMRAARDAGRPLQLELETEHGLDHPISFREGAYLKCLFTRA
jgi:23S rRNA (cytosine1962-C5)-methyltransferase